MAGQLYTYTTPKPSNRDAKLDTYNNAAVAAGMPRVETQVFRDRNFAIPLAFAGVQLESKGGASE